MIRAYSIIEFYPILKEELKKDSLKECAKIRASYGKIRYIYTFEFSNTKEASIEFEKQIKESLEYYDKLGWIAEEIDELEALQKELLRIGYEVTMMR